MNNCKIQKLISLCLTFSNLLILPAETLEFNDEKSYLNDQISSRTLIKKYLLVPEILEKNYFSLNSENIIAENRRENIDEKVYAADNELFIESKVQSEKDKILYAEGDVIVNYKNNILKADSLVYNKKTKLATAEGNIQLKINNQIFEAEKVEYDFSKNKGNFKNIKGLINFKSIISDFDLSSEDIYKRSLSFIKKIKKDKVVFTPDSVVNWIFSAEKLEINENKWSSKKAFLTNDLLDSNQIKFQFNEFEISPYKEKLRLNSKINYLIFQDKIKVPFWVGNRTIFKNRLEFQNRWNIGYDEFGKDGYFLGRKFNPIQLKNELFLNIEPQFLLQRTLKGYTRSFSQKNYSINSPRVERNISLSDYFGLSSSIEGSIKNWDIEITKELNSLDLDKFANAFRTKAEFIKEITLFDNIFVNRLFGAYRERIWNGSIGESEIFRAYGWKLEKANSWSNGSKASNQLINIGIGDYKAEELNTQNFIESFKGSINYQLNQKITLKKQNTKTEYIDRSYEYIPTPIKRGIFINTQLLANYNLYQHGNYQHYFGIGIGPEFVFGDFKRDYFDYTRIAAFPLYRFKSGKSLFKFDQISENFILNLILDQQLVGPLLMQAKATLNLDNDSDKYGEFIYSNIGINLQKRSYSFGLFYQPHNQAGGISFSLNGFK